ncbi:MAG: PAS domain S-box-containing protein [Gammaproteobacteria bacterium]|jgi:PAS domain S-box-containing protein
MKKWSWRGLNVGYEILLKTTSLKSTRDVLSPVLGGYLFLLSGACSLLVLLSISRYFDTGWLPLYTLQLILYSVLLCFTFVPKLHRFSLIFVIAFFMMVGTIGVLQFGFAAGSESAFVVAMVITTIGFGYIGLMISVCITISILLAPHIAVMLEPIISTGLQPYLLPHTKWSLGVLGLLFFGGSASYLVQRLVNALLFKSQQLDISLADNVRIAKDMTQLIDTVNAPIFGIDAQGNINEWNQKSEIITGFSKTEVIGRNLLADLITENYRDSVGEVLAKALGGEETVNFEFPLFTKSGDRIDVLLNSTTRRNSSGTTIGVIGVGQDITELNKIRVEQEVERKEAAAQIIQSSKLATLGEMATSVAHELNQPLNVIRMAAGNSRRKLSNGTADPEYLKDKLERIEKQTARAAVIIDHMRMFGREAKEHPEPIDPRNIVSNALDLMGEQLRLAGIEIVTELAEDCPSILGHVIQLEQVILNLLTNARDAMAENDGEMRVILRVFRDDKGVHITSEDTGGGIPEAVLPRIFEPFYTTKEMGKGTGLGLSVSYGIIRDMDGAIRAENIDDGARFTITLPVAH